jgi:hypothetical protein
VGVTGNEQATSYRGWLHPFNLLFDRADPPIGSWHESYGQGATVSLSFTGKITEHL